MAWWGLVAAWGDFQELSRWVTWGPVGKGGGRAGAMAFLLTCPPSPVFPIAISARLPRVCRCHSCGSYQQAKRVAGAL